MTSKRFGLFLMALLPTCILLRGLSGYKTGRLGSVGGSHAAGTSITGFERISTWY